MWRTLLSTPHFMKSHLSRKPHQENLILIDRARSVHSIATVGDGAVSRKLESLNDCFAVAGSCDGLVLLEDWKNVKFLVNPITLQQVKIRDSPLALEKGKSFSNHGFGYDRISDDYKIVVVSFRDWAEFFVDVYSVKSGVWRRGASSPYDHHIPCLSCGALVSGAIHWLVVQRRTTWL